MLVLGQDILSDAHPVSEPVTTMDSLSRDSPVTRTQSSHKRGSKSVTFYELPFHIVREISGDPIALISSLLLIGFYLGQIFLAPRKGAKPSGPEGLDARIGEPAFRAAAAETAKPDTKPFQKQKSFEMVS